MNDASWLQWAFGGVAGAVFLAFWKVWERITRTNELGETRSMANAQAIKAGDDVLHARINELVKAAATKDDLRSVEDRLGKSLDKMEGHIRDQYAEVIRRLDGFTARQNGGGNGHNGQ